MLFAAKLEELRNYIDKLNLPPAKHDELKTYLRKWYTDARVELGFPASPHAVVGVSFDDTIHLARLPQAPSVPLGNYIAKDSTLTVEVVSQEVCSGLVYLNRYDSEDPTKTSAVMSADLFEQLFERIV